MEITFKRNVVERFEDCFHATTSFSDTLYILNFEDANDVDSFISFQASLDKDIKVTEDTRDSFTFLYPNLSKEDWIEKGLDVRFREEDTSFGMETVDNQKYIYFWFDTKFNMDEYVRKNIKRLRKVEIK